MTPEAGVHGLQKSSRSEANLRSMFLIPGGHIASGVVALILGDLAVAGPRISGVQRSVQSGMAGASPPSV